jgi:O-antigen/teichoic acid export membrane protein
MFTTANLIISRFSEPASVVAYNLANKYLSLSNIIFAFILIPYWGAFTDAFVNKDYDWINRELNQLRKIWYISIFFIFVMIIFSSFFYKIWLEDKIQIPFSVTFLTGVYFISMNLSSIYYSLLNGIGLIDYNFKLAIVQLLCFYPLIMGFQFVFDNIIHSVLCVMILNMIVSKVLLKRFYLNFKAIE